MQQMADGMMALGCFVVLVLFVVLWLKIRAMEAELAVLRKMKKVPILAADLARRKLSSEDIKACKH